MAEKKWIRGTKGYTALRNKIETALTKQLKVKGGDTDQYVDLVRDYMRLWDLKNELLDDIEERGAGYHEYNSTGNEVWKSNPSVKDSVMVSRQMLAVLKDLGLNADNVGGGGDDPL